MAPMQQIRTETWSAHEGHFRAEPLTRVLNAATRGERGAVDRLLETVYDELRALASARLAGLGAGQSLRPTDLVHEAYLKLVNVPDRTWENRRHFINAAGTAMRSVIVDRARARNTQKRGGDLGRVELDANDSVFERDPAQILAMDEALEALKREDERAASIVSLRVFLGLTETEIADLLSVTDRTVQRDWKFARAWLTRRMREDAGRAGG